MDIVPLRVVPERHHWINTVVGLLDQAFNLTDDEQVFAIGFVDKLLDFIQVPDRGDPVALPIPVVLEVSAQVYTTQLDSARGLDLVRPVRAVRQGDVQVSVETWVEALLSLVLTAYPELSRRASCNGQVVPRPARFDWCAGSRRFVSPRRCGAHLARCRCPVVVSFLQPLQFPQAPTLST